MPKLPIQLGIEYFADPTKGYPVFEGDVYFGIPFGDPLVEEQRISVYVPNEPADIEIAQPVELSAGGLPLYNGSPTMVYALENYSVKVLDKNGAVVFYAPSQGDAFLGLAASDIGSAVMAYDAELQAIADLIVTGESFPYFTGAGAASLAPLTSAGRALLDDATAADQRATLGVRPGIDVQAYDPDIPTIAATTPEMQAGTETARRSMSPKNVAEAIAALGGGGGAEAFCAIHGRTYAILSQHNVSSVTDVGSGYYRFNFTTPFATGNYAAVCSGSWNNASEKSYAVAPNVYDRSTTSVSVGVATGLTTVTADRGDVAYVAIAIFGG